MLEACRESRHSGKMVEKLVEGIAVQVSQSGYIGYEDFEFAPPLLAGYEDS